MSRYFNRIVAKMITKVIAVIEVGIRVATMDARDVDEELPES